MLNSYNRDLLILIGRFFSLMYNKGKEGIITKEESSIPVYVLGTDEELMIARDTYKIVG